VAGLSARAGDFGGSSGNLDLVGLPPLMARTSGRPDISIGLIDGPIAVDHPELSPGNIHVLSGQVAGALCGRQQHGSMRTRHVYRRRTTRQARFRGARHLSGMHSACASDLRGGNPGWRDHPRRYR
jgi:hypothetical protein